MGNIFDTGGAAPSYPLHINTAHKLWLTGDDGTGDGSYPFNVKEMLESHFAQGSPYETAYSFDPTEDMDAIEERLENYREWVDTFDPKDSWGDLFDEANTKISAIYSDTDDIDAAVVAFDDNLETQFNEAQNRFVGGMYEANAVNGSAFVIGMALMEDGRNKAGAAFRAQTTLQRKGREQAAIAAATSEMSKLLLSQGDMKRHDFTASGELHRMNIIAQGEYLRNELDMAVEDSTWDLELFKYGGSVLGSVSGIPQLPSKLPKGASALQGALGGFSAVAPLAAASGNVGLGAVLLGLGGLLGAGAGYGEGY